MGTGGRTGASCPAGRSAHTVIRSLSFTDNPPRSGFGFRPNPTRTAGRRAKASKRHRQSLESVRQSLQHAIAEPICNSCPVEGKAELVVIVVVLFCGSLSGFCATSVDRKVATTVGHS